MQARADVGTTASRLQPRKGGVNSSVRPFFWPFFGVTPSPSIGYRGDTTETTTETTTSNFESIVQAKDRIIAFQEYYEQAAKPFQWKFTRRDLNALLKRLKNIDPVLVA